MQLVKSEGNTLYVCAHPKNALNGSGIPSITDVPGFIIQDEHVDFPEKDIKPGFFGIRPKYLWQLLHGPEEAGGIVRILLEYNDFIVNGKSPDGYECNGRVGVYGTRPLWTPVFDKAEIVNRARTDIKNMNFPLGDLNLRLDDNSMLCVATYRTHKGQFVTRAGAAFSARPNPTDKKAPYHEGRLTITTQFKQANI